MEHRKKERKRGRKSIEKRKKAPRVYSKKRRSQYFERRETLQHQKFFFI
jgi:hypothetical protein